MIEKSLNCGNCAKENPCPCLCHKDKSIHSGYHENISALPFCGKVKDEGEGPKPALEVFKEFLNA